MVAKAATSVCFKDIEDFFITLNNQMVHYGDQRVEDLSVYIDSLDTGNLNIAPLGYGVTKMSFLYNSYVDYNKLLEFYDTAKTSKKTTICFDFKEGQGCIKSLVLTRDKTSGPFQRAKVFFRTTDLSKKIIPDLFLVRHIIEECPNIQFQNLVLFISQGYLLPAAIANTYNVILGLSKKDFNPKKVLHKQILSYIKTSEEFDLNDHNRVMGGYFKLLEYKYRELNDIHVPPVTYKECKAKLKGIERRKANGPKNKKG